MHKRRFVTRTIKNGQVKIYGRIYKPTSKWLEYDGRLDGQRWAFGLYWQREYLDVPGVSVHWEQLPFVELWGTEKAYIAARDNKAWVEYCNTHPHPIDTVYDDEMVNWYYPWATWHTETTQHKEI